MPVQEDTVVSVRPSVKEALILVRKAISAQRNIILVGNCRVDYRGRASSKLEIGERILIVKEDGSVMVHRSRGYDPVNWQPPGCVFHSALHNNDLMFKAIRQKPREVLTVFFDHIMLLYVAHLVDEGEFSLYATEEDMRKAILLNPSLIEEGLKPISYEKKVEPGFIDVYGIDQSGRMVVIEIKRKRAGKDAALQLAKYVESLRSLVSREIRGILVAPQISKGVQELLVMLKLDFKLLDPKKCSEMMRRTEIKKIADFL